MEKAYCFKCLKKQEMVNVEESRTKNNMRGLSGFCKVCRRKLFLILGVKK